MAKKAEGQENEICDGAPKAMLFFSKSRSSIQLAKFIAKHLDFIFILKYSIYIYICFKWPLEHAFGFIQSQDEMEELRECRIFHFVFCIDNFSLSFPNKTYFVFM